VLRSAGLLDQVNNRCLALQHHLNTENRGSAEWAGRRLPPFWNWPSIYTVSDSTLAAADLVSPQFSRYGLSGK
jgi:hypothetical protein